MTQNIIIVLILVVGAVLGYAATRPGTFRVQRATTIKAAPEKIFPHINDLHAWTSWSPYENKDPVMKRSFSGPAQGVGAAYDWEGNKEVGTGHMEILDASPSSRVEIQLDFLKPFEAHNFVEFTLEPQGDATQVTWAMRGPSPYLAKLMGLFFSMDKMVGGDFEAGLAKLKAVAEQ